MSGYKARPGSYLYGLLPLGLCIALCSCAQAATPTAILRPTPDAVDIYIMMTEKYTSASVILSIYSMSADDAARIVRALQAIEAPYDLQDLHEQAVSAYQHVCAGKLLLPGSDNVLRSEALFMVDWGIALLKDYRERLDERATIEHGKGNEGPGTQ